jgi:hypothetical protein
VTINSAASLRARLRRIGLSDPAIDAAWPRWWSDDAEASASARAELRFGVARRLGLDPGSLLDDADAPKFLWRSEARFKGLTSEDALEQAGIASFGRAVAAAVASATAEQPINVVGHSALDLRRRLLASGRPYVSLADLVALSWGVGVPLVHLRIYPWPQKRMAAMTVRVETRSCILLGKDAVYPAWIAFFVAHELGHIALAHLQPNEALVDLDRDTTASPLNDAEEAAADTWALELLTGQPDLRVVSADGSRSAAELARVVRTTGPELGIEPGTLALLFAHSTGSWATANAALRQIYAQPAPVWHAINRYARRELHLEDMPEDAAYFLTDVLALNELA